MLVCAALRSAVRIVKNVIEKHVPFLNEGGHLKQTWNGRTCFTWPSCAFLHVHVCLVSPFWLANVVRESQDVP